MAATAKVIELRGNPKKPESAEHIIKFPGGSIGVCRTSANEYWAHIEVNRDDTITDSIRESAHGRVVGSRIDYAVPGGKVVEMEDHDIIEHIAIRIAIHK